ncbi:MAG: sigma-E processing peptidase SpoIIGA [Clostridia bacterium]|nr:sigma-E processing peptidase SpoIIGA [Clostridia bacterium]
MQVIYIDVFFLINFTVNLMALFLAFRLSVAVISLPRLFVCSFLGAVCAVVDLFLPWASLKVINSALFLIGLSWLAIKRASLLRRVKLTVSFFILEALLGGLVYFLYSALDRLFSGYDERIYGGASNRGALVFSLIILFSVGVLRLVMILFSRSSDTSKVHVRIKLGNESFEEEAFVDSGNLVRDPMGMCPVIFVKSTLATRILPGVSAELCDIGRMDEKMKRRVRLIPLTRGGATHVLVGIRADSVEIFKTSWESVDATLAIDNEKGNFGGYEILVPSSVTDNA